MGRQPIDHQKTLLLPLNCRVIGKRYFQSSGGLVSRQELQPKDQATARDTEAEWEDRESSFSLPPDIQFPTSGVHWPNPPQASWPQGLGKVPAGWVPLQGKGKRWVWANRTQAGTVSRAVTINIIIYTPVTNRWFQTRGLSLAWQVKPGISTWW